MKVNNFVVVSMVTAILTLGFAQVSNAEETYYYTGNSFDNFICSPGFSCLYGSISGVVNYTSPTDFSYVLSPAGISIGSNDAGVTHLHKGDSFVLAPDGSVSAWSLREANGTAAIQSISGNSIGGPWDSVLTAESANLYTFQLSGLEAESEIYSNGTWSLMPPKMGVPEPVSWVTMLFGIAMIGGALRNSTSRTAAVTSSTPRSQPPPVSNLAG